MSNMAQLSAKERITSLLDDYSFVEIGAYVTKRNTDFNLLEKEAPADGVITGYGVIDGNLVYVYSQDATTLGGTMGEMHVKKILRIYELALKVGAPVIGLIDSKGIRLQEATDALNAFGEMYLQQTLASGVIPQISAIFGSCGGGAALISELSDFTFMTEKTSKLFVNSPNVLDGNYISKNDTSSSKFQSETAGNVDFVETDDLAVLNKIRTLISLIPANNEDDQSFGECEDNLNRLVNISQINDTSIILKEISDDNFFMEVKSNFAKEMVTGFIRLNGNTVGAIANRSEILDDELKSKVKFDTVLTSGGCEKASKFLSFCDAFNIPVLTLTNVVGFKATVEEEKHILKACAKLTHTFSNATIPKVNLIIGKAYGSAYIAMNSKHIGADMVFAFEDAEIGMMDSESAVKIIYADEINNSKNIPDSIKKKADEYKTIQSSPLSAAKRGYVDDIIEADQTRQRLIYAFEMLFTKREGRPNKKHSTK